MWLWPHSNDVAVTLYIIHGNLNRGNRCKLHQHGIGNCWLCKILHTLVHNPMKQTVIVSGYRDVRGIWCSMNMWSSDARGRFWKYHMDDGSQFKVPWVMYDRFQGQFCHQCTCVFEKCIFLKVVFALWGNRPSGQGQQNQRLYGHYACSRWFLLRFFLEALVLSLEIS